MNNFNVSVGSNLQAFLAEKNIYIGQDGSENNQNFPGGICPLYQNSTRSQALRSLVSKAQNKLNILASGTATTSGTGYSIPNDVPRQSSIGLKVYTPDEEALLIDELANIGFYRDYGDIGFNNTALSHELFDSGAEVHVTDDITDEIPAAGRKTQARKHFPIFFISAKIKFSNRDLALFEAGNLDNIGLVESQLRDIRIANRRKLDLIVRQGSPIAGFNGLFSSGTTDGIENLSISGNGSVLTSSIMANYSSFIKSLKSTFYSQKIADRKVPLNIVLPTNITDAISQDYNSQPSITIQQKLYNIYNEVQGFPINFIHAQGLPDNNILAFTRNQVSTPFMVASVFSPRLYTLKETPIGVEMLFVNAFCIMPIQDINGLSFVKKITVT